MVAPVLSRRLRDQPMHTEMLLCPVDYILDVHGRSYSLRYNTLNMLSIIIAHELELSIGVRCKYVYILLFSLTLPCGARVD